MTAIPCSFCGSLSNMHPLGCQSPTVQQTTCEFCESDDYANHAPRCPVFLEGELARERTALETAKRTKYEEIDKWKKQFEYCSAVLRERSERLYAEKLECHAEWCRAEAAEARVRELDGK